MLPSWCQRKRGLVILAFVGTLLLSCSADPEVTFVDFSDRISVDRPGAETKDHAQFRVAVGAMVSAQETAVYYHQLLDYIATKLERKIQLVQRKTYKEINELISLGQIDLAFICSGPYIIGRQDYGFKALAAPQIRGSHFYQSYLIVNRDSPFHKLEDLRGKVFAFTDPESNTGKMVPTYWLRQLGVTPEDFFKKTIYTYSHDNSIMAVALSLVDGAAVHSQIWEYYNRRKPDFTSKSRVIKKSVPFGSPPVVASSQLPGPVKNRIQSFLLNMHQDPAGKRILAELMIDRFIAPEEKWYDPILAMKAKM